MLDSKPRSEGLVFKLILPLFMGWGSKGLRMSCWDFVVVDFLGTGRLGPKLLDAELLGAGLLGAGLLGARLLGTGLFGTKPGFEVDGAVRKFGSSF